MAVLLVLLAGAGLATTSTNQVLSRDVTDVCNQISRSISNVSSVFFPREFPLEKNYLSC